MKIIDAKRDDINAITQIYNHAVAHTTAIWNESLVDEDNRIQWWRERLDLGFPVLVAKEGNEVLGYASYGPFRPHDGFRHTVEHSVYVREGVQGQGIGRKLMMQLIDEARTRDVHVMVGAIEADNLASIGLHKSLGFVETGRLPQVGKKFGKWLDLALYQRIL